MCCLRLRPQAPTRTAFRQLQSLALLGEIVLLWPLAGVHGYSPQVVRRIQGLFSASCRRHRRNGECRGPRGQTVVATKLTPPLTVATAHHCALDTGLARSPRAA